MKATLEFNLPDDNTEYELARLGERSHLVIWEMWNELCNSANDDSNDDDHRIEASYWLNELLRIMDNNNVPLEVD